MKHRIAYDCTLRQPGCVLIQAAMGGSLDGVQFLELFPNETWLLAPTDDMRVYEATDEQLQWLSAMTVTPTKRRR